MNAGTTPVTLGVIVSTESVTRVRVTTGAVTVMAVRGGVTIDEIVLVTVTGTDIELIDVVRTPLGSVLTTVDMDIEVEIDTVVDTGAAEVRPVPPTDEDAKTPVVAVKGPLVALFGGVVLHTGQQGCVVVVIGKSITNVFVVPLLKPPIPAKIPCMTCHYLAARNLRCLSYRVCCRSANN